MKRPPVEKLQSLTVNSHHNLYPVFEYIRYLEKQNKALYINLQKAHVALENVIDKSQSDASAFES